MFTVIVPRADVRTEEVADVLREGLGSAYTVLPGVGVNRNPVGDPRPDHPDSIVVGSGWTRLFRAEVRVSRRAEETVLHVVPGGLTPPPRLINRLWIGRRVLRVLRTAQALR